MYKQFLMESYGARVIDISHILFREFLIFITKLYNIDINNRTLFSY